MLPDPFPPPRNHAQASMVTKEGLWGEGKLNRAPAQALGTGLRGGGWQGTLCPASGIIWEGKLKGRGFCASGPSPQASFPTPTKQEGPPCPQPSPRQACSLLAQSPSRYNLREEVEA